jgi:hypothetical protein
MHTNQVNDRTPLRIFELAGYSDERLGAGQLALLSSEAELPTRTLLVQIGLDHLLRGRRVLHLGLGCSVTELRARYDEAFHELVITLGLRQPQAAQLEIERNRLLHALPADADAAALQRAIEFAREVEQHPSDAVLVDGLSSEAAASALAPLAELARGGPCELWAVVTDSSADGGATKLAREAGSAVSACLHLGAREGGAELLLRRSASSEDTHRLPLEARTMLAVIDELPPRSAARANPADFRLVSGGAKGAEAAFGTAAEQWGLAEVHYSFAGHPFLERERGVVVLGDDELRKGDASLMYASHRLGRPLSEIPNIKRILQTVWHQIRGAEEVFVIGALQENGVVRGGTGWGAELARLWGKPVYLFDQEKGRWLHWDVTTWAPLDTPTISRRVFAAGGTTSLTQEGREAIRGLFERSFGPPTGSVDP